VYLIGPVQQADLPFCALFTIIIKKMF
jgi:hypothetical protein